MCCSVQRVQRGLVGLLALSFLSSATQSSRNDTKLCRGCEPVTLLFVQVKAAGKFQRRAIENAGSDSVGGHAPIGNLIALERYLPNMALPVANLKELSARSIESFTPIVRDLPNMTHQRLGLKRVSASVGRYAPIRNLTAREQYLPNMATLHADWKPLSARSIESSMAFFRNLSSLTFQRLGFQLLSVLEDNRLKSSSQGASVVLVIFIIVVVICTCTILWGPEQITPRLGQRMPRQFGTPARTMDSNPQVPLNSASQWQTGQSLSIKAYMLQRNLSSFSGSRSPTVAASGRASPSVAANVGAGAPQSSVGSFSGEMLPGTNVSLPSDDTAVEKTSPKPLCPNLVRSVPSFFSMSFEAVEASSRGIVPIYGRDDRMMFAALIRKDGPGHGAVTLTMGHAQGYVLGGIKRSGKRSLAISDKESQHYGDLQLSGRLAFSLVCDGVEVLNFSFDERTGKAHFTNPNGARQAEASRIPQAIDRLGIEIAASVDPILVLLCIIGAMALT